MFENDIKCDNSVNRIQRVLKLPYDIFSMFLAKMQKKDTAMFIIASPVGNSK